MPGKSSKLHLRVSVPRTVIPLLLVILFLSAALFYHLTQPDIPDLRELVPRSEPRTHDTVLRADRERVKGSVSRNTHASAGGDDDALALGKEGDSSPRKCPHVVLFSSARHGSTWFIDSVERCRFSRSGERKEDEPFATSVFRETEPWKHVRSELYNMTGGDVARYVVKNSSIKVFSSTLDANPQGVRNLIRTGAEMGLPFVILRRKPEETYRSLRVAKESGVWNGVGNVTLSLGDVMKEDGFLKYQNGLQRYYGEIERLLREGGVTTIDSVDYDDIRQLKYIRLQRNDCYVRNCNFEER